MQLHKLRKHASELEWSGGRRGRVEVEGLRGSRRWVEKGKGGHTMTLAEFAYNNKVHVATHQTPFELNASQHLCLGVEPMRASTVEAVDAFAR